MDQKHQAQDNAALRTEQKGLNNCTETTKNSLTWASLSDYQQLDYNLRVNLFQGEGTHRLPLTFKAGSIYALPGSDSHIAVGRDLTIGGPLETRSLMRDSYTPDIFQKAVIDPRHWHGRKISELGRWYEKYFLDLNVQKSMKKKYGEDKKGSS